MSVVLQKQLLAERGQAGIYAVCSAHPWVIEAAALQALEDGTSLLVEATSNQVNQDGGYTGMRPSDFRNFVSDIAGGVGFPVDRLYFGGDHLGPNPWSSLDAAEAMDRACQMVDQYARAGFTKIHLDASMPCAGDPEVLSDQIVAERAARLCAAVEKAVTECGGEAPIYIIGTEVPPPGGASHALNHIEVTGAAAVERTLHIHQEAFHDAGLAEAWKRVLGIVVQPGVEFDHDRVFDYVPAAAQKLQGFLDRHPGIVFEAHSTDYQKPLAFQQLVRDGFAILKVGPGLTFALREALFALSHIEDELLPHAQRSHLREVLERTMFDNPKYWQRYYTGTNQEQKILRLFSYSDRIRYYWLAEDVQKSIETLLRNFEALTVPETLLSQYLPGGYIAVRGRKEISARHLVIEHIRAEVKKYSAACKPGRSRTA